MAFWSTGLRHFLDLAAIVLRTGGMLHLLLASLLVGMSVPSAHAQAGPTFVCDETLWLAQGLGGTQLFRSDLSTNPITFDGVGPKAGLEYNAVGYNPVDNYLYAIRKGGRSTNAQVMRISADGLFEILDANPQTPERDGPAGLSAQGRGYVSGTFGPMIDPADEFYNKFFVIQGGGSNALKLIDIGQYNAGVRVEAETIALSRSIDVVDIAWVDGMLYASGIPTSTSDTQLFSIDPRTGTVTLVGRTRINGHVGAFFGATDSLLAVANDGHGLFKLDVNTGRSIKVANAPGSGNNDGGVCPLAVFTFPADLSVTKTNTFSTVNGPSDLAGDVYRPGELRTYTIVASNAGIFGAQRARIIDTLPAGIDPATVSWTCDATPSALVTGGGFCEADSGAGSLDTMIDLPVDTSVRIDLTMTVPATFSGNLVNLVEIVPGPATVDDDPANNIAVDDDLPSVTLAKSLFAEDGTIAGQAEPGELLTYAITLVNSGSAPATGVDLTDVFDSNTTFVAFAGGTIAGTVTGQTISWEDLSVPANDTLVLRVTVRVDDPIPSGVTNIRNFVHRTENPPPACDPGDPLCVDVPTAAQIGFGKALTSESGTEDGFVESGETLTYTITLYNTGGTPAQNITLTDIFAPQGSDAGGNPFAAADVVTSVVVTPSGNGTYDPATGTTSWTGLTIPALESGVPGMTTLSVAISMIDPLPGGLFALSNSLPDCTVAGLAVANDADPSDEELFCEVVTPTQPLISFSKELTGQDGLDDSVVEAGETLTYTITVRNNGGTASAPFDLVDTLETLPATVESAVLSITPPPGATVNGIVTTIPVPAIDPFDDVTFTLVAVMKSPLPSGAIQIRNALPCIEAGCVEEDPTEGRIILRKRLTGESGGSMQGVAEPGETLTYTISATNVGGADVLDYLLRDRFTPVDAIDPAPGSIIVTDAFIVDQAQGVVEWVGFDIAPGQTVTRTISIKLADPLLPVGIAEVTNLVHNSIDPEPVCHSLFAPPPPSLDPRCVVNETRGEVDLDKQLVGQDGVDDDVAEPGELLTYQIILTNLGGVDVTGHTVIDDLDPNVTFVSADGGGVLTGDQLVWSNVTVPTGAPTIFTVQVQVNAIIPDGVTQIENVAYDTMVPPDCVDPLPRGCDTIPTPPKLKIGKSLTGETGSLPGVAEPGETLTYTLRIKNTGGTQETAFSLTDILSASPAIIDMSDVVTNVVTSIPPSSGPSPVAGTLETVWDNLTIPEQVGDVPGITTITLAVTLADPLPAGLMLVSNLLDNCDPAILDPVTDAGLVCRVDTPTPPVMDQVKALVGEDGVKANVAEAGETLTYTITATNNGGAAVTNYVVRDQFIPAAAVSAMTPGPDLADGLNFTGNPSTGLATWTIPTIAPGASVTRTVRVRLTDPLPDGLAAVTNTLLDDCVVIDPATGAPCDVTTATEANVTPGKTVSEGNPNGVAEPGETLTYTVTLTNTGGEAATGITQIDTLSLEPAGIALTDAIASAVPSDGGIYDPATGITTWTGLAVPPQIGGVAGTRQMTIAVTLADPLPEGLTRIVNTVPCIVATDPECRVVIPTEGRIGQQKALVGESITVNDIAQPGETLTYEITLTNNGGVPVTNFTLIDEFTPVVAAANVVPAGGGVYLGNGVSEWTGLTIPAHDGINPGVLTRRLAVTLTNPIPDGILEVINALPCTDPGCRVEVPTPTEAKIIESKALVDQINGVNDEIAEPGETLVYEITLTNRGGAAEPNYTLRETFFPAAAAASGTPSDGGIFDPESGTTTWTNLLVPAMVGTTPGIKTVRLEIELSDPLPAGLSEVRNVLGCEGPGCEEVTPTGPEIDQSKQLIGEIGGTQDGVAEPGETLIYQITLTNVGGVAATDYLLRDVFTPATALAAIAPGTGAFDAENFTSDVATGQSSWIVPSIAAGASVTRRVQMTLNRSLPEDLAEVRNLLPDCLPGTDRSCEVVTPVGAADPDVTVIKKAGLLQVHRGDLVPYSILVTNNDTSGAAVVSVVDKMPSGFRYVEGSGRVGGEAREPAIAGLVLTFPDVVVLPQQTAEIQLQLLVLSSVEVGRHENFAVALGPDGEPLGPQASAVVIVVADPVFDCSEVIGKVFDDTNQNGYQDDGEPGLPGVRLSSVTGLLITTDQYGRYHLPCAETPDSRIGTNFILKLDTRTLPTGYSVTTENPRVIRLTAGRATKLNFGAALGRIVGLRVTDEAFERSSPDLTAQWSQALGQLIQVLGESPSILRLTYTAAPGDEEFLARRMDHLTEAITTLWRANGDIYPLEIETRLEVGQ